MIPELQEYFENAKRDELIRRGLYEKKYYNPKDVTDEMRKRLEYDIIANRFVERIPYEVTDEEFKEIVKVPNIDKKTSNLSITFYIIGAIVFFFGLVYGINAFSVSLQIGLVTWLAAVISGMLFIGIGKIIDLLEKISNR